MNKKLVLKNVNPKTQMGTVNVLLDFSHPKRQKLFINTGVRVEKQYWDENNGNVKKSHSNHLVLNREISLCFMEVLDVVNRLRVMEKNINPNSIKTELSRKKQGEKTVIELMDEYIEIRQDLKERHKLKYLNVKTRLEDFLQNKPFYPSDINQKFVYDFTKYLQTKQPTHSNTNLRKSQSPSTIKKTFDFLKTILNYFNQKGVIDNDYKNLTYPKERLNSMVILEEFEVRQLNDYRPLTKKLRNIKDLILIQIFTGLRYSDIFKITPGKVINNTLQIKTTKTNKIVNIPIVENLRPILEKHKYDISKLLITNDVYNKGIKKLLNEVGINSQIEVSTYENGKEVITTKPKYDVIGSHTFRRTFITLSLSKGIPIPVIQSITGHSDLSQLIRYVHLVDDIKNREMNKLNFL